MNLKPRQIRIITLLPGISADDIRVTRDVISLDEKPYYEALSYVWGQTSNTSPILVDGRITEVTTNLKIALRHLRQQDGSSRTLWIDAICIEQSNTCERNQQVSLMAEIYRGAQNVILWFGDWDHSLSDAERSLADLHNFVKDLAANKHLCEIPYCQQVHNAADDAGKNFLAAMGFVVENPWWDRAWVVQEAVLASRAILSFGTFSGNWDDFTCAARNWTLHITADCCAAYFLGISKGTANVMVAFAKKITPFSALRRRFRDKKLSQPLLWELLVHFRSKIATDNRDKVFAFVGLIGEPACDTTLEPNYSLNTCEVYKWSTLRIISNMRTLNILSECVERSEDLNLPSWVPDWSVSKDEDGNLERACVEAKLFNASGQCNIYARLLDNSTLGLRGINVDSVICCTGATNSWETTIGLWQHLANDFWKDYGEHKNLYSTKDDWQNAFLRSLLSGMVGCSLDRPCGPYEFQDFRRPQTEDLLVLKALITKIGLAASNRRSLVETYIQGDQRTREVLHGILALKKGQSYIITSKGLMGLGPRETLPCDEVWVLQGSPVPFILSPCSMTQTQEGYTVQLFRLVGQCYIDGMMDGEATVNSSDSWQLVGLV